MSDEKQKFSLQVALSEQEEEITDDIVAAIAASVQVYLDLYDKDSDYVLTIKRVQRPYSPWSSKIYGLRQTTNNNFKR